MKNNKTKTRLVGITLTIIILFMIVVPAINTSKNIAPQKQADQAKILSDDEIVQLITSQVEIPEEKISPDGTFQIAINTNCITNYCIETNQVVTIPTQIVTSNDSEINQIIEENFEPKSELILSVKKYNSQNNLVETKDLTSNIFSFISEQDKIVDFGNGRFDYSFTLKSKPNIPIKLDLIIDVILDSKITSRILLEIEGITNDEGKIFARVNTQSGFTYSFLPAENKFVNGINTLELTLVKIEGTIDGKPQNSTPNVKIYTSTLEYDENQIISKNEQGGYVKIYPSDSIFTFTSSQTRYPVGYTSCENVLRDGSCGKTAFNIVDIIIKPPVNPTIKITDQNGVEYKPTRNEINMVGGQNIEGKLFIQPTPTKTIQFVLQRANTYTVNISGEVTDSFTLELPKSQKNYDYSCLKNKDGGITCNFP